MSDDDGVLAGPWRDGEFDLGVGGGKLGQDRLDKVAARRKLSIVQSGEAVDLLHALGAAGPVTVVNIHLLALEDEGAQAILEASVRPWLRYGGRGERYMALRNGP